MINVRKSRKGHRTVTFAPYGRVPLKDAKTSVEYELSDAVVRNGKRNTPTGCAIALCAKADAQVDGDLGKIPGFLAIQVRKTATLVALSRKNRIVVERYAHSPVLTQLINGFDSGGPQALKAGDKVTLLAPTGARRIGKSNGTSHPGNVSVKNSRVRKRCVRRGVFLDPVHAKQAQHQDPDMSVK